MGATPIEATPSSELTSRRLRAHAIEGKRPVDPAAVVTSMGALQAQDWQQALWAVGVRTHSATRRDVEQSIEDARIVRTWPMRGTIHFVPARDARWMLALCATRILSKLGRRHGELGIDTATLDRSRALFERALRGKQRLTRKGIMALLESDGIATSGQRGYHLLSHAAQLGVICPGPMLGKEQTFVLLDEWVPDGLALSREDSLRLFAERYVRGHGPATAHDFAWWTGLTLADARSAFESAGSTIASRTVDGREYWLSADAPRRVAADEDAVHLLPGFDEYLLGYTDRSAVLPAQHASKIIPGGNGIFMPTIVARGVIVGTWKRSEKKGGVDIVLVPFEKPRGLREGARAAAERYAQFLGVPLASLTVSAGV
jgi:hypothetical protein